MVKGQFSKVFYEIQKEFTGDARDEMGLEPGEVPDVERHLFDATDFRDHLNNFFGVGKTQLDPDERFTHWRFVTTPEKDAAGNITKPSVILDSIDDNFQPNQDTHCTVFALYNEVNTWYNSNPAASGIVKPRQMRQGSNIMFTSGHVNNLIAIYDVIWQLFGNQRFVDHCHRFGPWIPFGRWAGPQGQFGQKRLSLRKLAYCNLTYLKGRYSTTLKREANLASRQAKAARAREVAAEEGMRLDAERVAAEAITNPPSACNIQEAPGWLGGCNIS